MLREAKIIITLMRNLMMHQAKAVISNSYSNAKAVEDLKKITPRMVQMMRAVL